MQVLTFVKDTWTAFPKDEGKEEEEEEEDEVEPFPRWCALDVRSPLFLAS